jgi:hypothetical protein
MDLPGARDIHTIMRERLAAIVKARSAYSAAERNAIAVKLSGVKMPASLNPVVKEMPPVEVDGAKLTRVAFIYPDGLTLPACWVEPAKPDASRSPVVMVGQKGRGDWAAEVKSCVASGASVLVADITGYGEIGKEQAIFYGAKECPEEGASVMLYLMGESMTGRRASDMLVLADWVKGKTAKAPELVAKGSAAIPAAHARAAASDLLSKVSVYDAPMSWTEFIEKGDSALYRYTYMVVNGLLHYDWTDLLK